MIVNSKDVVTSVLERSDFDFYLTGSRFFKTETPISDYDYFVQDSDEVRKFLHGSSFRVVNAFDCDEFPEYYDNQTVVVFEKDGVHIQLVRNVDTKNDAQELLRTFPELLKGLEGPRNSRRFLWNRLYIYTGWRHRASRLSY